VQSLNDSGVSIVEIAICEVTVQEGIFRCAVPATEADLDREEIREFVRGPSFCFSAES
jgi:hypothetical protein